MIRYRLQMPHIAFPSSQIARLSLNVVITMTVYCIFGEHHITHLICQLEAYLVKGMVNCRHQVWDKAPGKAAGSCDSAAAQSLQAPVLQCCSDSSISQEGAGR